MEVEVGELLLELQEVFEIEHLVEGARAVEVVHDAVGAMACLGHPHDLGSQGGHTGTAAHPYHLGLGVDDGMEVSVGAAHHNLVARLEREDVTRRDARGNVLESDLGLRLERRRGDAHGEHEAVAFLGIIGHGVCADGVLVVLGLEGEETEFLPCGQIFVADECLIDVLVVVHLVFRDANLGVASGDEVHMLAGWELDDELLDERRDVLVGDDGALPFLDVERGLVDLDLKVSLDLDLASETPVVLDLLAREVHGLCGEYVAAARDDLQLALAAAALAAACAREVHAVVVERGEQ